MSKRILSFSEFGEINEASVAQPTLIQKALAQAAEVKGASKGSSKEAGKKENVGKTLIRDLFFATKFGGDLLAAVDTDPNLKAAWEKDNHMDYVMSAAMAKLHASDTAMWVTTEAVQVHGGYGFVKEFHVERLMRDAKITQIYEGTSEIQKMVIGRSITR